MKDGAKILKLKGRELRTSGDITLALEAIMQDLVEGNITPREAKAIQREINERIKTIKGAMKTLSLWATLNKLQKGSKK